MTQALKLGHAFELVVTTPDLRESLKFYEQLGYKKLVSPNSPAAGALLTDGVIRLSLREQDRGKTTLTYYAENVEEKIATLEPLGLRFDNKLQTGSAVTSATFRDPNGLEVNLVQAAPSELQPIPQTPISQAGQFGELSVETEDVAKSLEFWLKLGFEPSQYMPDPPIAWASITDGLLMLGIYLKGHCPHVIKTPSITYFEADMPDRILRLKQEGMSFLQELPDESGKTGHAIAEAPEGQLLFLFSF
jgi:predicted enzyme related to lactoylglutathione lyase